MLKLKAGQEGDPSSPKALLWMTAKGGLGDGVMVTSLPPKNCGSGDGQDRAATN
jgi:hypothetical protein